MLRQIGFLSFLSGVGLAVTGMTREKSFERASENRYGLLAVARQMGCNRLLSDDWIDDELLSQPVETVSRLYLMVASHGNSSANAQANRPVNVILHVF